jgi:protein involved in polysaccharide export with SLBB domain
MPSNKFILNKCMKISKIIVLIIGLMLFSVHNVQSQSNTLSLQNLSNVNTDEIPDAEIQSYLKKASDNGLTDQYVYKILQEKGLPLAEIDKLKNRIDNNKTNKKITNKIDIEETVSANDYTGQQSIKKTTNNSIKSSVAIYGSELFLSSSQVFEPNLRISTPVDYVVGPDDELIINVYGLSEQTYKLTINQEGNIYIPQVGPIYISGLSIEQATNRIRQKLASTIYKALNSGNTKLQIALAKIKSIHVTIIGETKKPGTYTVSSLSTLFNILYLSGGPTDLGSYRTIELIRGNIVVKTVDLYSFLSKGEKKDNLLLREGDVIRIPYYKNRITINGNVKRIGKYEVIANESFDKILEYCGGFTDDAYKASVTIYQLTDEERKIINLPKSNYKTYFPLTSDSVFIRKISEKYQNKITIAGAIERPGDYELTENITLYDLIEKAGSIKKDVYHKRGSITRLNEFNFPIQLSFNVDSIIAKQTNISLKKNDSITLYSNFDLLAENFITIQGNIKRPGNYKWAEHITLKDVILFAGGFPENGDLANIEIARRTTTLNLKEQNHIQTEIININVIDSNITKDIELQPFDIINLRQKAGYTVQRNVFIEGMVLIPGQYALKTNNDKITDLLKRAGGFIANADTTSLIIKRVVSKKQSTTERQKTFSKLLNIDQDSLQTKRSIRDEINKEYEKISIDLAKALSNENGSENMLLEDGDILSIEQNTNLIKVSGEVYFTTIIPYKKNASLKYYIQKSGSYTQLARKNGTLVIYPDGKAKKVRHFLFFKKYPKVVSGSEIFIPQKSDKNKAKLSVAEWSVILSSLAVLANVIISLR